MHPVYNPSLPKSQRRKLWDTIIQEFLQSELTFRAFSESKGLRQDHLSYYVAAYRKKQRQLPKQSQATSSFIPLMTTNSVEQQEFKIKIAQVTAYLPLSISKEQLTTIIKGLSDAC